MNPLALIGSVLYIGLLVYFFALWARFAFDLVQTIREHWRPRGAVLVLAEATFTITDPPIKAVRRLVPPMRVGAFSLDFGFTIVMFAVIILIYVAVALQQF